MVWKLYFIQISPKFLPKGPTDNKSSSVLETKAGPLVQDQ